MMKSVMGLLTATQASVYLGDYPLTTKEISKTKSSVFYQANTNFQTCKCDLNSDSCDAFCCCDKNCADVSICFLNNKNFSLKSMSGPRAASAPTRCTKTRLTTYSHSTIVLTGRQRLSITLSGVSKTITSRTHSFSVSRLIMRQHRASIFLSTGTSRMELWMDFKRELGPWLATPLCLQALTMERAIIISGKRCGLRGSHQLLEHPKTLFQSRVCLARTSHSPNKIPSETATTSNLPTLCKTTNPVVFKWQVSKITVRIFWTLTFMPQNWKFSSAREQT